MPVLADFDWQPGPDFNWPRLYLPAFAIGWQPDAFALTSGRFTHLQEISFGGYRVVVEFKEWVWLARPQCINFDDMFENFYATAPGDPTPISAGHVIIETKFVPDFSVYALVISLDTTGDHYYWQRFPTPDPDYWALPFDELPVTPFWFPV